MNLRIENVPVCASNDWAPWHNILQYPTTNGVINVEGGKSIMEVADNYINNVGIYLEILKNFDNCWPQLLNASLMSEINF